MELTGITMINFHRIYVFAKLFIDVVVESLNLLDISRLVGLNMLLSYPTKTLLRVLPVPFLIANQICPSVPIRGWTSGIHHKVDHTGATKSLSPPI
jgi:hypothetical protein